MNETTKYKVGDTVYVEGWKDGLLVPWELKIKYVHIDTYLTVDKEDRGISYGFDGVGDTREETNIMGKTKQDVINYIKQHYAKEIKKIESKRDETIKEINKGGIKWWTE
jgi:hypothetical protein